MKQINGLAIIFLLAFAVSVFVFITKLFSEEEDRNISVYRVEVKEVTNSFKKEM